MNGNKTVWITGASSGIGEALALNWAAKGADLILSARTESALEAVGKKCRTGSNKVIIQIMDLASPESINQAFSNTITQIDRLDYIFLNGGLSQRSLVAETNIHIDRMLMEINYFGNVFLSKLALQFFINQGHGHFVITSSLTGVFGIPLRSSYSASKHALHGFFDSLRAEQVHNNIKVTIVCPGFIKTNISVNALSSTGQPTGIMDKAQNNGISADVCAKKMISAALSNKKEVYIGGKEVLMVYFKRYFPFIYYKLASRVRPN